MLSLFALQLVLLGVEPANEAQKLYEVFLSKVAQAENVRIVGTMSMKGGVIEAECKAELILSKGNKVNSTIEMITKNLTLKIQLISDGMQTRLIANDEPGRSLKSPGQLDRFFRGYTCEMGLVSTLAGVKMIDVIGTSNDKTPFANASNFEMQPDEKVDGRECKVITFVPGKKDDKSRATIWLDSKTQLPVKRLFVTDTKSQCTEHYSVFDLDPKIDKSQFDAPTPKK